jgi:nitric oxide reductase subunit B
LVGIAFWGLNIGLAMMVVFSLFPGGIMQVYDVIENGYWHARSLAYTASPLARTLEWMRMPGDLVFIFAGATPFAIAVVLGYLSLWAKPRAKTMLPDSALLPAGKV